MLAFFVLPDYTSLLTLHAILEHLWPPFASDFVLLPPAWTSELQTCTPSCLSSFLRAPCAQSGMLCSSSSSLYLSKDPTISWVAQPRILGIIVLSCATNCPSQPPHSSSPLYPVQPVAVHQAKSACAIQPLATLWPPRHHPRHCPSVLSAELLVCLSGSCILPHLWASTHEASLPCVFLTFLPMQSFPDLCSLLSVDISSVSLAAP